jgi:uncharacterized membrane protein
MKLRSFAVTVGCALIASSAAHAAVVDISSIDDLGLPGRETSPNLKYSSVASALSADRTNIVGTWLTTLTATANQGWLAPDAAGVYQAADLGAVQLSGSTSQRVVPTGVNDSQRIVGALRFNNVDQAFYATPPHLAANNSSVFAPQSIAGLIGSSTATGINNRNLVVGFDSSGANGVSQSFVYTIGGSVERIRELNSSTPNQAYAINTGGMIGGWAANAAGERQAFLARTANGSVTQPTIIGSRWSEARAINTRGDIAGCSAGRAIAGGDCSGAVSADGTSTGDSTGSEIRAFIVQNGKAALLDLPAGYTESFALGISAHDIVVGTAHAFDQTGHLANSTAFLWANGTTTDLSLLLPPHDPANPHTGWESLVTATAITESPGNIANGQEVILATVVGQGMIWASDPLNPSGPFTLQPHAFRLDVAVAVPEPETWMLLLAGISLFGWVTRQRLRTGR